MQNDEKLHQIIDIEAKSIIAIDVGGTSLKWSIVSPDSSDISLSQKCFQKDTIDSRGTAESIICSFAQTIESGLKKAVDIGIKIGGIGISMPGPFDYKAGISYMTELVQKYQTISGINLKSEFIKRLQLTSFFPIKFYDDGDMFLVGEAMYGAGKGFNRIIGLTLGTGIGASFMVNGKVVIDAPGIPPKKGVWAIPYRNGIVDDYVTRRGILKKYREFAGKQASDIDVKELALMADNGDTIALRVFECLDEMLCEILHPILTNFQSDCLVFGGQISKSFHLFSKHMQKVLGKLPRVKIISTSSLWDLAAICGVGHVFWSEFESKYFG